MGGGDGRRFWWVLMGGFGQFRTPPLDEWPLSVGFLRFAISNWELAKNWLPPRWSQHGPLTSSWSPERASTSLWCVENDFPSGLASDSLWKALHHIYVRRDTSLQKVLRDTLPVELVRRNKHYQVCVPISFYPLCRNDQQSLRNSNHQPSVSSEHVRFYFTWESVQYVIIPAISFLVTQAALSRRPDRALCLCFGKKPNRRSG
jgi:hypothetical protein